MGLPFYLAFTGHDSPTDIQKRNDKNWNAVCFYKIFTKLFFQNVPYDNFKILCWSSDFETT